MAVLQRLFQRHLEDDEPLYLLVHKHWILSIKELSAPIITLVCTWGVLWFAPIRPVFIVIGVIDLVIAVWFLRNFLDYYLDALIITDRAIIDVEWHGWFHRESTRIDHTSIEGVSYEIQGVAGTLLNFGTITVERIGNGSEISIENVKKPKDIESAIVVCQSEHLRKRNLKDTEAVKDIIADIVAERMQMNDMEKEEDEWEFEEDEVEV